MFRRHSIGPAEPLGKRPRELRYAFHADDVCGERILITDAAAPELEKRRQIRRDEQVELIAGISEAQGDIALSQNQPE